MTESEIYKGLSVLTKSRDKWEERISSNKKRNFLRENMG